MFGNTKQRNQWNESLCNPFNGPNRKKRCPDGTLPNPNLIPPEQPYIRNIAYPRITPFANVEKLRTPIDNLIFEVYRFNSRVGSEIPDGSIPILSNFEVFKYQAYLPHDTYVNNGYYMTRCYARNDAGKSVWSNTYIMDYADAGVIPCLESIGGQYGYDFKMDGIWTKDCPMFAEKT